MTDALVEKVARAICLAAWDYDYTPRDPLHPDTRWVQATRAARAAILAVLEAAGFTPPLHTGVIHKALQDAFQSGANEAVSRGLESPTLRELIELKHAYCDKALSAMLTASKEPTP